MIKFVAIILDNNYLINWYVNNCGHIIAIFNAYNLSIYTRVSILIIVIYILLGSAGGLSRYKEKHTSSLFLSFRRYFLIIIFSKKNHLKW